MANINNLYLSEKLHYTKVWIDEVLLKLKITAL